MRILFVDGTEGHNPKKTKDKPTGGTLTSLTYVPEYLASIGYEVYVQSQYDANEDVNGVHYVKKDQQIPKWDVVVFNRNVLPKEYVLWNKQQGVKIIWWLHDIVDTRYLSDDAFTYVDHIVGLSEYCKETYANFYQIDKDKFSVIPNGVDKSLWYPGDYEKRNPNLYITCGAMIKGMLPTDLTFMTLLRHFPDLDFRIFTNQSLHGFKNSPDQDKFLYKMSRAGAHIYQPVSQDVLAHLFRKAWCLIMPNSYPEICANTLLQARACGLPVSLTGIGSNVEYCGPNLMTKQWQPHDLHSWIVEFANNSLQLGLNPKLHKEISEKAPEGVLSWEGVGNEWDKLLQHITKELSVLSKD